MNQIKPFTYHHVYSTVQRNKKKGMKTKFNKLQEIDKTNPFKVPENYFEKFNEEIMNHLPDKEYAEPQIVTTQIVTMWDRVKPWVYMAAMFVGLYITINFLTNSRSNSNVSTDPVVTQQVISDYTNPESYWSNVHITEEEFYLYLEEQLIDDGYFDYMYDQYYFN